MTTRVTSVKVITYREGVWEFTRAVMTCTANGILITGWDPSTHLEYSRYIPRVKIKEIYINGNKKERHSIPENESV